jgi:hypothetical protein
MTPEKAQVLLPVELSSIRAERPLTRALAKPMDFRGLLTLPSVAFLRVGLSHSVHHRGQLSMYLRPIGAAVPSIYGESYDAKTAREAGAR